MVEMLSSLVKVCVGNERNGLAMGLDEERLRMLITL